MDFAIGLHVGAALIALIAGSVAVSVRKGQRTHIRFGLLFVITMIVMAIPAGIMSYQVGKIFDVLSSLFTGYMVLTGMLAFNSERSPIDILLAGLAVILTAAYVAIEVNTLTTGARVTDAPTGAGFVFAGILAIALYGDLKTHRQPNLHKQARLTRHLWRMNFGFFMATINLFGVRPHLFPEWMQSSGLLTLLAFAPLLIMMFWQLRLRTRFKVRVPQKGKQRANALLEAPVRSNTILSRLRLK